MAYLAKFNWRFHEEKESFWAQVLRKKYLTQRRLASNNAKTLPSTCTWKAMNKGLNIFKEGTRWSLGRDSNILFWRDNWISKGPLRSLVYGPLQRGEEDLKIGEVVTDRG